MPFFDLTTQRVSNSLPMPPMLQPMTRAFSSQAQNVRLADKFRAANRKRNALVGGVCGAFVISVYGYSLLAVRQENFDDVPVPGR
jgi:hypothetical protein